MDIRNIIETSKDRHLATSDLNNTNAIRVLSKLDQKIYEDIVLNHEGAEKYMVNNGDGTYSDRAFPYTNDTDELIASHRFMDMYCYYLACEHDTINNEQDRYNNHLMLFNEAYQEFVCWYNENHMPVQRGRLQTAPSYKRRVKDAFPY